MLKSGYLQKTGGGKSGGLLKSMRGKGWKKRYFVLTPTAIAYYVDHKMTEADLKGGVLLENTQKAQVMDGNVAKQKSAEFNIITGDRTFACKVRCHRWRHPRARRAGAH